jgi:hypothetical protein
LVRGREAGRRMGCSDVANLAVNRGDLINFIVDLFVRIGHERDEGRGKRYRRSIWSWILVLICMYMPAVGPCNQIKNTIAYECALQRTLFR